MDANVLKVASTVPEWSQDLWISSEGGLVKRISSDDLSSDESGDSSSGGGGGDDDDDDSSSKGGSDDNSDSSSGSSDGDDSDGDSVNQDKTNGRVGIAVGVAVGVPVFVVLVVLGILLWVVYRRNKREAKADHDPDFTGDIEYLPNASQMYDDSHSSSANDETKEMDDSDSYLPPKVKQRMTRHGIHSIDPFRIPERNDSMTIREFGKQHDNAYGPYKMANNNNNNLSSYEVTHPRGGQHHSYTFNALTSKENVYIHNASTSRSSSVSEGGDGDGEDNDEEEMRSARQSPVKSVVGEATRHVAEEGSGLDASESGFDDSLTRSRDALIQKSRSEDEQQPRSNETSLEMDNNNKGVSSLSAKEEEDIQRMKSVYKVYYDNKDKDKDIDNRDRDIQIGQFPDLPTLDPLAGDNDRQPEPGKLTSSGFLGVPGVNHDAQTQRVASSIYSSAPAANVSLERNQQQQPQTLEQQEQQLRQQEQQLQLQQQQWQQEQENLHQQYPMQQPIYDAQSYGSPQFFSQPSFTPQQYAPSQFSNMSSPMQYGPPPANYAYMQPTSQRAHPQTLESIDELPTPTNLPYSSSSLSLTSFKMKGRQAAALPPLQAAVVHGTAANPMDHPEMFYAQNDEPTQPGSALAPYKMRQSVVMTDPSQLTLPANFRPAGSIRNVSGMNTRNNSITTQMNPYYRQQAAHNARVSGLLADEDVLHPPSLGGILPHSGSNEDLRKQLGSSQNYKVT